MLRPQLVVRGRSDQVWVLQISDRFQSLSFGFCILLKLVGRQELGPL